MGIMTRRLLRLQLLAFFLAESMILIGPVNYEESKGITKYRFCDCEIKCPLHCSYPIMISYFKIRKQSVVSTLSSMLSAGCWYGGRIL